MKASQQEADYGRGSPINHCGICVNFRTGGGIGSCSKVMGRISPHGLCGPYYKFEKNPFGSTLSPNEVIAIKRMAADAADRAGG